MSTTSRSARQTELPGNETKTGPVDCLGLTFESDDARRAHFTEALRARLKNPEFRRTPGFPAGTDEDILRLSDPPYYTACPNPFLAAFVGCYGRPFDAREAYDRDPFAVDTSVGKTDGLYKAHGYHTKVPHLAIVPSILHYTRPGDVVLDGFCGSGMTGVAAQWCGTAPETYRRTLEAQWKKEGLPAPEWGARRAVLNDLSPAATLITAGLNLPFPVEEFATAAERLLEEVDAELGWMYETAHKGGKKGRINYTVWSEVFSCPECAGEVNFVKEALDKDTKCVRAQFPCPKCGVTLNKDTLQRVFDTVIDPATKEPMRRVRFRPVLINYDVGDKTYERTPSAADLDVLTRIEPIPLPPEIPTSALPLDRMYHGSRVGPKGITHVHHFFLPRAAQALSALWRRAQSEPDPNLRRALLFFVEQAIWGMSVLARYAPTHYSQVNQCLNGVYYVGSQIVDVSPWYILEGKRSRLLAALTSQPARDGGASITTGDCAALVGLPDASVDYVFTDPPFGENIYYADLNLLVESWHRVLTNTAPEAIVDPPKQKGVHEYQGLMRRCFQEYHRVLKPGRWMTVVFSNSSNAIWRAIQEAMGAAGFVVADVRTLDKQQGSYRQVTSSAVKQDLVISAYKPSVTLAERFTLGSSSPTSAWDFVSEHLARVPRFVASGSAVEVVAERTAHILYDHMVAFHVQRNLAVPLSTTDFLTGLSQRYPERDGMYFLPQQVAEYDRRRTKVAELRQLSLFVTDEASAIQWVRQQLAKQPQTFQDLQPVFMKELQGWAKHEKTLELRDLLDENFLEYDGKGPVPSQIHSYLSHSYHRLRNLDKDDAELKAEALHRWYVPDPGKQADMEKLRERALLREFQTYLSAKERRLKQFRTEAIRAGFKFAYEHGDYETIVTIAGKLPEAVLQEDEKLLMYFDVASTRLGA